MIKIKTVEEKIEELKMKIVFLQGLLGKIDKEIDQRQKENCKKND